MLSTKFEEFINTAVNYVSNSTNEYAIPLVVGTTSYAKILDEDFQNKILNKIDWNMDTPKNIIAMSQGIVMEMLKSLKKYEDVLYNNPILNAEDKSKYFAKREEIINNIASESVFIYKCASNPQNSKSCSRTDGNWGEWD